MRARSVFLWVALCAGAMTLGCDESDNGLDRCESDENCPGGELCVDGYCKSELNPDRDSDGDGILDSDEVDIGTEPYDADSDDDGIEDGVEVGGELADPLDTDGDGIIDARESASLDADGDGIVDQEDPCNDDPTCPVKPPETCNDEDDDYDGEVDEDFTTLGDPCEVGFGVCRQSGIEECELDGNGTRCSVRPGPPDGVEVCNNEDDDCDGQTDEGVLNAVGDCRAPQADVCDGEDNDFEPDSPDGSADDWYGQPCDGDGDADLCEEGTWDCVDGEQVCVEAPGEVPELCDGADNDCNPETRDGRDEGWVGTACDGPDSDKCTEGVFVCRDGVRLCDDLSGDIRDLCDGLDNDCDEETADGAHEPWFESPCDSDADVDLCLEGRRLCDGAGGWFCEEEAEEDVEVCDGVDNDCNPQTADGAHEAWLNTDCDGQDEDLCADGSWVCRGGGRACTDDAASRREVCDGADNDCDQAIDEGFDAGAACVVGVGACVREGEVTCSDDGESAACDARPGAPGAELCATDVDEDCDGETDEGFDELGEACTVGVGACQRQGVYVCAGDGRSLVCSVGPGAAGAELCGTGIDEDCDGSVDEAFEALGAPCNVGVGACQSDGRMVCDDDRLALHCDAEPLPPGEELCGNGADDNCDGEVDEGFPLVGQACGVGVGACQRDGVYECDDDGAGVRCGAAAGAAVGELCGNGVDDDCDEAVDEGFDVGDACSVGVGACARDGRRVCAADGAGTTCNAAPGAPGVELCGDGIDDDCDGRVDEGFERAGEACSAGVGECARDGQIVCTGDGLGLVCTAEAAPAGAELCGNDADDDCDGLTDEGFAAVGDACVAGRGECRRDGRVRCSGDGLGMECDTGPGQPGNELCGNGVDDDCDGAADEGYDVGRDCVVGVGACSVAGVLVCTEDALGTTCDAAPGDPAAEVCGNGVDEDCDGVADNGFPTVGDPCAAGVGACQAAGSVVCTADGADVECDAVAGAPAAELCGNAVDEDCDGSLDEGYPLGDACQVGVGACLAAGVQVCDADGAGTSCDARPGAAGAELCGDGVDNDCDGRVDEGFPGLGQVCTLGVGECAAQGQLVCNADRSGTTCDARPGAPAPEVCDGLDNDCDGDLADDGADAEGLGARCDGDDADFCEEGSIACLGGQLRCDDFSGETPEVCNGEDDNCDGQVDEDFAVGDACREGVGACARDGVLACAADGQGVVCTAAGGAPIGELCGDGQDNDCDGQVDEGFPTLGDDCSVGVGACRAGGSIVCAADGGGVVCDAVAGAPGAEVCDGVDNDCDPATADGANDARVGVRCDGRDADRCEEGVTVCRDGGVACTDESGDNVEVCDGEDNDCDGVADEPFEDLGAACAVGVGACSAAGSRVCNAAGDGTVCDARPGEAGPELCDGVDNDCDGDAGDDGADEPDLNARCDGDDGDLCEEGARACVDGRMTCTDDSGDDVEACNGEDDDCDGSVDEAFGDLGDACAVGVGECARDGAMVCAGDGSGTVCSATPGDPGAERCDGLDNDCDGDADDGDDEPTLGNLCDGADADRCEEGEIVCVDGGLACSDETDDRIEICDGEDNDCDGQRDEGFAGLGDDCAAGVGECLRGGSVVCTADGLGVECDAVAGSAGREVCDGLDNDCDGEDDDGADEATLGDDCDGADRDACEEGSIVCADGALACDDLTGDDAEVCDGEDNNCDGVVDEGFDVGAACNEGVGECRADGVRVCTADGQGTQCNAVGGDPIGELCGDGVDNDCDGAIDEGFDNLGDACAAGVGECAANGVFVCTGDRAGTVCDARPGAPAAEVCDGLDNDCDGADDDGSDEPTIDQDCDGDDADACDEGVVVCADGALLCDDRTDDTLEVCNGEDDDCDGAADEDFLGLGDACSAGLGECRGGGTVVCTADGGDVECDAVAGEPAAELCDGRDNDCDGDLGDDGADEATIDQRCDGGDADRCLEGNIVCVEGGLVCDDFTGDDIDVCDGEDNNCDGVADERFPTLGDACAAGVGECRDTGTVVCTADGSAVRCDATPGQPGVELCDGLDNDCDGDPNDDGEDEEGVGGLCDGPDADQCLEGRRACLGGRVVCTDQTGDDVDICDGEDNDCDGAADEDFQALGDACQVGVGLCRREGAQVCTADGLGTACSVAPGQPEPERCDGLDNDCDGADDDGEDEPWAGQDCDGGDRDDCLEGTFVCNGGQQACTDDSGDDVEVCDGADNDCDGVADEPFDDLGDACSVGTGECRRDGTRVCAAGGAGTVCSATPGQPAPEACDGLDNDCDGANDDGEDEPWAGRRCDGPDGDACLEGDFLCQGGRQVCTDRTGDDVEVCDGQDNDCDGARDEDFPNLGDACSNGVGECQRDGVRVCGDGPDGTLCDAVPGDARREMCDGLDNDCDGDPNDDGEDDPRVDVACDGLDTDECLEGVQVCRGGGIACTDETGDDVEVCDGEDNDCDGQVDEGFAGLGDDCQAGVGECRGGGSVVCNAAGNGVRCDAVIGEPGAELCDGLDNDCDGDPNDDGTGEAWIGQDCDGNDAGVCEEGVFVCGPNGRACTDRTGDDVEVCDGGDNDCDGAVDEGFAGLGDVCSAGVGECRRQGVVVCTRGQDATECSATPGDPAPEVCDGLDNDCDPRTADGAAEAGFEQPCDGEDADLCTEGLNVCVDGEYFCDDDTDDAQDICDGADNDCNPDTPDGSADEGFGDDCDGRDSDVCLEGTVACVNQGDGFQLECDDVTGDDVELCDGVDNDCDGQRDEGFPGVGAPCSVGVGACARAGFVVCTADGSGTECSATPGQPEPELCDGVDNDCDPASPDGFDEPGFDAACDGDDTDLCREGRNVCEDGRFFCDDLTDDDLEVCDGRDNDCNGATADGQDEPRFGVACDGRDSDLCPEGAFACVNVDDVGFRLRCSDESDDDLEVCDGRDNDCNGQTPDGADEPTLGNDCDGDDADNCTEGQIVCQGGGLACSDPNDADPELCDGIDNDCNAATADGADEPWAGQDCDGADADLCDEGTFVCSEIGTGQYARVCTDVTGNNVDGCGGGDEDCDGAVDEDFLSNECSTGLPGRCDPGGTACIGGVERCVGDVQPGELPELCNGSDDDCDPRTLDGSDEPNYRDACDGADADLCNEGFMQCVRRGFAFRMQCDDVTGDNTEVCDGIDNDCIPDTEDGVGDPNLGNECDGNDADVCFFGTNICQAGRIFCDDPGNEVEVCNNEDDDCDGQPDEGNPGGGQVCNTNQPGICAGGTTLCTPNGIACIPDNQPGRDDTCNATDEDCDNESDEHFRGADCDTGLGGACGAGLERCVAGGVECQPVNVRGEVCDGVDNDCDGAVDNDLCCPANDLIQFAAGTRVYAQHPLQTAGSEGGEWAVLYPVDNGNATSLLVSKPNTRVVHGVYDGFQLRANPQSFGAPTGLAFARARDRQGRLQPVYVAAYTVDIGAAAAQYVVRLRGLSGDDNRAWTSVGETPVSAAPASDPAIAAGDDEELWVAFRDQGGNGGIFLSKFLVQLVDLGDGVFTVEYVAQGTVRVDSGGVGARAPRIAVTPATDGVPTVGVVWVEGEPAQGSLRFRAFDARDFRALSAVRIASGRALNPDNFTCDAPDMAYALDDGGPHFAITCGGNDATGGLHAWYTPIDRLGRGLALQKLTGGQNALASLPRVTWQRTTGKTYVAFSDNGQQRGQYLLHITDRRPSAVDLVDPETVPTFPAVQAVRDLVRIPHLRIRSTSGWYYEQSCR